MASQQVMETDRTPDGPRVRAKVWVEHGDAVLLSDWRVALLEAVDKTGSLAAAAAQLDVPYRTAWHKVKEIEERLGVRLLRTESGGADGGGSSLTDDARDLVARFRRVTAGIADLVERRYLAELGDRLG